MASKHDAKRARENFWVMQQNLAKQKGGRALYQPRPPKTGRPLGKSAPLAAAPEKAADEQPASAETAAAADQPALASDDAPPKE